MNVKEKTVSLLAKAGIEVNGPNPWDIQVHDERVYARIWSQGSIGAGESYMDGWWDVEDMTGFFFKLMESGLDKSLQNLGSLWYLIRAVITNMQNRRRAYQVGEEHYDIGNDLYERMLDKRMAYSCGYWKNAKTLDEAQEAKLDLICRKLSLKPGQTVLDVGCGWGSFLQFAAERYGVKGVGITVSKEQAALARKRCEGLPIEIRVEDYRNTTGQFDHIISIGMFEHVGPKNYRTYMKKMSELLKDDGLFLLHSIGSYKSVLISDPWFNKYIFPNGVLPSVGQIGKAINKLFILEDWHNFGIDYDKTLQEWYKNFNKTWPEIEKSYSPRFYRMWRYYLLSVAGGFRARRNQLWQVVLSKRGVPGGYQSIR